MCTEKNLVVSFHIKVAHMRHCKLKYTLTQRIGHLVCCIGIRESGETLTDYVVSMQLRCILSLKILRLHSCWKLSTILKHCYDCCRNWAAKCAFEPRYLRIGDYAEVDKRIWLAKKELKDNKCSECNMQHVDFVVW